MTSTADYTDIKFEIKGEIGIIKVAPQSNHLCPTRSTHTDRSQFNRPKALNSFGGNLIQDVISALRVLNEHPDTVFTVLTGEGRFFSAGADVRNVSRASGVRVLLAE
jgi:peroxisomal 3,2-trans-enoyl-CoA isomerase